MSCHKGHFSAANLMSTMSAASISFFLVALTVVNDYVFVLMCDTKTPRVDWTGRGCGGRQ